MKEHPIAFLRRFAVRVARDPSDPEKKRWLVQTIPALSVGDMGEMTRAAIQGLYGEFMQKRAERVLKSRGIDPQKAAAA